MDEVSQQRWPLKGFEREKVERQGPHISRGGEKDQIQKEGSVQPICQMKARLWAK